MVIKIKLFWGGNGSSPLLRKKNITITEILYKRRGQAQLDIVNRLFEIHSTVFERVHSSLFFFSFFFSFNVRFFFMAVVDVVIFLALFFLNCPCCY